MRVADEGPGATALSMAIGSQPETRYLKETLNFKYRETYLKFGVSREKR